MVCNPRSAAPWRTLGATPWAENTQTAPTGTSVCSSTKIAPRSRNSATTCLLCTISLRTYTGRPCNSSARSTVCTARSTPAQYPRGAASSSFSTVLGTGAIVGPTPATLRVSAPAPPRQAHPGRRSLSAPGGTPLPHAHRRPDRRRGPAAADERSAGADPQAAASRAALSPQAGLHGARQRQAGVGGRSRLQPRVPHSPHRAAHARALGAAVRPDRAHLLAAARSLEAAVGDVADRGARG